MKIYLEKHFLAIDLRYQTIRVNLLTVSLLAVAWINFGYFPMTHAINALAWLQNVQKLTQANLSNSIFWIKVSLLFSNVICFSLSVIFGFFPVPNLIGHYCIMIPLPIVYMLGYFILMLIYSVDVSNLLLIGKAETCAFYAYPNSTSLSIIGNTNYVKLVTGCEEYYGTLGQGNQCYCISLPTQPYDHFDCFSFNTIGEKTCPDLVKVKTIINEPIIEVGMLITTILSLFCAIILPNATIGFTTENCGIDYPDSNHFLISPVITMRPKYLSLTMLFTNDVTKWETVGRISNTDGFEP